MCSLNNKVNNVLDHLSAHDVDIAFITETWLKSDKNCVSAEVKQGGFTLKHNIRNDPNKKRGGGVGILAKSSYTLDQMASQSFTSFEHTIVRLHCTNNKIIILISIYRLQHIPISLFHKEFTELLEIYTILDASIIIAGDVNIHVETEEVSSVRFHEILNLFDLKQHVSGPTHIMGHTIDVVITRNHDMTVGNIKVTRYNMSHHFLIDFEVNAKVKEVFTKTIHYRKLKDIDNNKFTEDIKLALCHLSEATLVEDKVTNYTTVTRDVVDKHAPLLTKDIKINPRAPWFDSEYASIRRKRRKAEKNYRRSGSLEDKALYIALTKEATNIAQQKKNTYIKDKLNSDKSSKNLYSIVNNLLDNNKEVCLPSSSTDKELANKFQVYFREKVNKIRASIHVTNNSESSSSYPGVAILQEFEPSTIDELRQIVRTHGIKCSPEDPVPAFLLKENIDIFLPYWLDIVNLSLEVGSMECLKSAAILPLIKELGSLVDKENFKNYRPVSNLLFISKLIERVVDIRFEKHMTNNNLHSKNFGYKKDHSTEMLLLKIVNDLLLSCDDNTPTVVLFLDLSAAFDTVDHEKLLHILYNDIGIRGTAYNWCKSFLTNRKCKVMIGDSYSAEDLLWYGVAQGSILGPRFFNIYTKPLYKYIKPTKFEIEGFADDHQLMRRFILNAQCHALQNNIEYCLNRISQWMNDYFLKLNEDKTKILVIAPPSIQKEIYVGGVLLNNGCIRFDECAKNLGILIDDELSFEPQVNKVVKSCFNIIRKLWSIKRFLTIEHLQTLICSYIFSKIDYCNCLYYGINQSTLDKLQRVQNSAARLIRKIDGNLTLDEVFKKFHWLKVHERILYKILVIVHKCLIQKAPPSLCLLVSYAESDRTMKLCETRVKTKFGDRAFSHVGPKLWNMLPWAVRKVNITDVFKKSLKSYLIVNGTDFIRRISIS